MYAYFSAWMCNAYVNQCCIIPMFISVYVLEGEAGWPLQWVGSVLLVLVQWARPCIRQVELQGEFCNTWPVSLSHLCGWRREGTKSLEGRAAQVVRGDWRHEWQWKVIAKEGEQQLGEPEGGKMRWRCLHISPLFFLSLTILSLLQSLTHFSLLTPLKLKGQKSKCTG